MAGDSLDLKAIAAESIGQQCDSQRDSVDGLRSEDDMSDVTLTGFILPETQKSFARHWVTTIASVILPSPMLKLCGFEFITPPTSHGPTAYLDGCRGVASFCVFLEHFVMRFHPKMFEEYGDKPNFFQLPIIRLMYSGSVMVALFFVVSGFALSLRPLEAIHDRDWERLHKIMSSAAFRRAIRIFLPPIGITFLIALGVRLNLFTEKYSGAIDMDLGSPVYATSLFGQLNDWLEYVLGKIIYPYEWLRPVPGITTSEYAAPLYTIPQEYWSSILLFVAIVGLSRVRRSVRIFMAGVIVWYSHWCLRKEISCFFAGMMIAELHLIKQNNVALGIAPSRGRRCFSTVAWSIVFVSGLWMASVPHARNSYGSSSIGFHILSEIVPWNGNLLTFGSILIIWGISNLPFLQWIFTTTIPRYLGQISFALYLVHWPILAAWGWKITPTIWRAGGGDIVGFTLALLCVIPVVIWAADLYWRFVDTKCIDLARRLEKELLVTKGI